MKGKVLEERFFLWYFANDGLSETKKQRLNLLKLTTLLNGSSSEISTINLLSVSNFQNLPKSV